MNDNSSPSNSYNRREERRQRIDERRAMRAGGEWIGGALLLFIGLLLLGRNLNFMTFDNWWAFFIMLPAIGSFSTAWGMYHAAGGHFTMRARSAMIVGLVLTAVTAMFLFNLNWTILGPGLLILAGVGLLVNVILPGGE
jgi:cation transport ATPase